MGMVYQVSELTYMLNASYGPGRVAHTSEGKRSLFPEASSLETTVSTNYRGTQIGFLLAQ